jgi:hypothetical protein
VLGTRYGEGVAIDAAWPLHRRVISKGARLLAQPLTPLSDPMTGFFGLTKVLTPLLLHPSISIHRSINIQRRSVNDHFCAICGIGSVCSRCGIETNQSNWFQDCNGTLCQMWH